MAGKVREKGGNSAISRRVEREGRKVVVPEKLKEVKARVLGEMEGRVAEAIEEVMTPQYLRALVRANAGAVVMKLVDRVVPEVPREVVGPGAGGEHVFVVHHAIRRSELDGPEEREVVGEVLRG